MAQKDVEDLRRMVDEPFDSDDTYSDAELQGFIDDKGGDLSWAASYVWTLKAAKYARLVNTSESGSSRSLGDMAKNAQSMAAMYQSLTATITNRPHSRHIVRR